MMEMFAQIPEEELQELSGGIGVAEAIFGIVGVYAVLREVVRDAGAAAAYRDLGY